MKNSGNITIIGGGLAGLISAIRLAQLGLEVVLFEKKSFPFHKVCGEYISNEVLPFLESLGIDIAELQPARINQFLLTSPTGNALSAPLDLGGFGISRYTLDNYLANKAKKAGVKIYEQTAVQHLQFNQDKFLLQLSNGQHYETDLVIGSYGKRTNLDRQLNRRFFTKSSPYVGVKYHIKYNFPKDLIALHNFKDGYAGISAIEEDKYCFCYLTTRANLKAAGSIKNMETQILAQNPYLKAIFKEAQFLYLQPEVINEISFAPKSCVENHVLLCGDAAGLITPLCGNGMAMAMHSGKILTDHLIKFVAGEYSRSQLELAYTKSWEQSFATRLWVGRMVQSMFGRPMLTELLVSTFKHLPAGVRLLMQQTHGRPF